MRLVPGNFRQGKAIKRHDRGIVYLQLTERTSGATQPIAVGIDPGSKKEAYMIYNANTRSER